MNQEEIVKRLGEEAEFRTMEIRADESNDLVIEGYAAVFEQETDLGIFREKVNRGAFENVLEDDVRLLLNHDGAPLARTTNGSLKVWTDDAGLKYRATLSDTQAGRDLYKMIQRGDISQSSFAFTIKDQEWNEDHSLRSIKEVGKLLDVSPVTYPAYPTASVSARNLAKGMLLEKEAREKMKEEEKSQENAGNEPKKEKSQHRNFTPNSKQGNMTINDLKGQRAAYYEEFVAIGQTADAEGRAMTEAEQERSDKLDEMIKDLDVKIRHKHREQEMVQRLAGAPTGSSEQKEIRANNYRFSLSRAISQAATGKLEGVEAEWAAEAHREMRNQGLQPQGMVGIPTIAFRAGSADNFQATPTGDGSGFVPTDVPFAIEALREPTFLQSLGVQAINATGTLKFPRVANPALATEKTEVAASTGAGLELDEITMSPRRVSAKTTYSKQLILQGGSEVDRLISGDIQAEMAEFIDREGFKEILESTEVTDLSTAGTSSANVTTMNAALAIAMEKAVLAAKGNLAGAYYVMSPGAYAKSKTLTLVDSVSALFENGKFNGYDARATAHIADVANATESGAGQMIFGNFRQGLLLAYFGGIDLLVDPFSNAGNAQVTLHVNRYFDVAVRQGGAFSIVTDIAD